MTAQEYLNGPASSTEKQWITDTYNDLERTMRKHLKQKGIQEYLILKTDWCLVEKAEVDCKRILKLLKGQGYIFTESSEIKPIITIETADFCESFEISFHYKNINGLLIIFAEARRLKFKHPQESEVMSRYHEDEI